MKNLSRRIYQLESIVNAGDDDMVELIHVFYDDHDIPTRRELMTKAEYYRRYPERRAAENDGQPIHVWIDWGRDEPEKTTS